MAAPKKNIKQKPKPYINWTYEEAEKFLIESLDYSKTGILTFVEISNKFNQYTAIFDYLTNKFENLKSIKEEIKKQLENNIVVGAMQQKYNATFSIFNLKNNYGWKDKSEVDSNVKLQEIPVIKWVK